MAAAFYENLFTSEGSSGAEDLLQIIEKAVTDDMNASVIAPFSDKEIETTLF